MNCKPGDIARIVHPRLYGRLVEVLFLIERNDQGLAGITLADNAIGHWMCVSLGTELLGSRESGAQFSAKHWPIDDKWLRPIRDQDGDDEMLRIVGKPQEVNA